LRKPVTLPAVGQPVLGAKIAGGGTWGEGKKEARASLISIALLEDGIA